MDFSPSVREYFHGKTIFITGATGYVGRFLIYKMLKDLDVHRIYICLRGKRGKSFSEREAEYKNLELFQFVAKQESLDKIIALEGDINLPNLGFNDDQLQRLNSEVDIVIHAAASIRFNEPIKVSSKIHINGTSNVIELAAQMKKLQVFIHVSSIGAWCNRETLTESVPEPPYDPIEFANKLAQLSDDEAKEIEGDYIGEYPHKFLNSYTLTKSLAEVLVERNKHRLRKVAIVRPPFLMASSSEPKVGWFDEPQTGAALSNLYSLGLLRLANLEINSLWDVIPIDLCSNALIGITWYMGTKYDDTSKVKVFNMPLQNTIRCTGYDLQPFAQRFGYMYPSVKQIRPPSDPLHFNHSKLFVQIKSFFTHTMFSLLIDMILFITGQKPMLYRLTSKKISMVQQIFERMCHYKKDIQVDSKNIGLIFGPTGVMSSQEQAIFFYDLRKVDWYAVAEQSHLRFRRRVLKEPDETIPYARKRLRLICIFYDIFKLLLTLVIAFAVYQMHLLFFYNHMTLWTLYIAAVSYTCIVMVSGSRLL